MQKYSREVRLQHLEAWKQQGISGSEYCNLHGIRPTTFYSWIKIEKKLASQDAGKLPGFVGIHPDTDSQPQMMQSEIVIRKGAISISVPGGASQKQIANILSALGASE